MRVFLAFDDTDTVDSSYGTGKLARWFEAAIGSECTLWGVVRQQLLVHPSIPYTSHNSAACLVLDVVHEGMVDGLCDRAVAHIERHAVEGSDPGLCIARETDDAIGPLMAFGMDCTQKKMRQADALRAANGCHLSGHGGTEDGIIGAAAAVGLTAAGWHGRLIEYGRLRNLSERLRVSDLQKNGIEVVSLDRNAQVPSPDSWVDTKRWVRPRLMGGRAVLLVRPDGRGHWENIGEKRKKAPLLDVG